MLDSNSLEVIHIDFSPHRIKKGDAPNEDPALSSSTTASPPIEEDSLIASGRARFPYPDAAQEYLPDLLAEQSGVKASTRSPLKPLHIVQPEGVSFKMNGNEIEWQKWRMHIGKKSSMRLLSMECADGITILFNQPSAIEKDSRCRRSRTMTMGCCAP